MIEDGARGSASSLSVGVVDDDSEAGGGSMPAVSIPGVSVEVRSSEVPAEEMQRRLRLCEPPVVARVVNDAVRLHMRAVFDEDLCAIANAVIRAVGAGEAWRG